MNTANVLVGANNQSICTMGTGDLINLFSLDDSSESEPPQHKRKRPENFSVGGYEEEKWSLEELWNSTSQYEEQHSIENFIGAISPINMI